jgi:hypothetical protein
VAAFGRLWPPLKRAQKKFLAAFETIPFFWQPSAATCARVSVTEIRTFRPART